MAYKLYSIASFATNTETGFAKVPVGRLVIDESTGVIYRKTVSGTSDTIAAAITASIVVRVAPTITSDFMIKSGNNLPSANNAYNLGSASFKYANIYATNLVGTAVSSLYADLAENYLSDKKYEPGTVLMIGGKKEVTLFDGTGPLAGVVSTKPGFVLNSELSKRGRVAIALKGRIPVKVIGDVIKGDYLIAHKDGKAIGVKKLTAKNRDLLIGVALVSGSEVVEAKV